MLRPRLLLVLTLAGCAAAPAARPAPSPLVPQKTEAPEPFDWRALAPKAPADRSEQILSVALPSTPGAWDPHKAHDEVDRFLARSLFEGLVTRHPASCRPIPAIAERWDVSPDRRIYTFHLRRAARWSTGVEITAADVVWSLERAASPDVSPALNTRPFVVTGGEGMRTADTDAPPQVASIEATGDRTVRITLIEPDPRFIHALAGARGAVVHRESVEQGWYEAPDGKQPAYSGAFVQGPRPERRLSDPVGRSVLLRNRNHWASEHTWLESVMVSWPEHAIDEPERVGDWYARGRVDWCPWPDGGLDQPGRYLAQVVGTQALLLNCRDNRNGIPDWRARLALSLAIDREAACRAYREHEEGGDVVPATGLLPPDQPGYTAPPVPARDVARARRLMEAAGHRHTPLEVNVLFADYPPERAMMMSIANDWQQAFGARVQLNGLPFRRLTSLTEASRFQVVRTGWSRTVIHPLELLRRWTPKSQDLSGLGNAAYAALVERAAQAPPPESMQLLAQAERMLVHELAAVIPLHHARLYGLLNPKVKGLTPNVFNEHRLRYLRVE